MKLACAILCGPDLSNLPRAVASIVDHVDLVILIDTVGRPGVLEEQERGEVFLSLVSHKTLLCAWPWQGRFDAARNEALALAAESGVAWSITLDSDEWYDDAELLRGLCDRYATETHGGARVDALLLPSAGDEVYYQPRAIRLPCSARWIGRTHEAIDLKTRIRVDGGPRFCSDPKTPEQVRAKAERDLPLLLAEITEKPEEARWLHYLGNTLACLGEGLDGSDEVWGKAIDAYLACANLSAWPEEKARVLYLAARILAFKRKDYRAAIELCMAGLAAHAGISELPFLAADCARKAGNYEQALYLAALAEVHGEGSPYEAIANRTLHVSRDATRDGPAKIMAEVYRVAGATEREAAMREKIAEWAKRDS